MRLNFFYFFPCSSDEQQMKIKRPGSHERQVRHFHMEETTQVIVIYWQPESPQWDGPIPGRITAVFQVPIASTATAIGRDWESQRELSGSGLSDGSATLADKNLARDHTSITHTLPWRHPHRHLTGALPLHTNITVTDRYRNLERPGDPDRILIQAAAGDAGTSSDACLFGTVGVLGPCARG